MSIRLTAIAALIALSACAAPPAPANETQAPVEAAAPDAPPTTNGVYIHEGCEGEGACSLRNWRVAEPTPLLAEGRPGARVIATLAPGQWVAAERLETRLVPARGVVRDATREFAAGDVVYRLWYEGEGFTVVWRRGELLSIESEDVEGAPSIAWEEPAIDPATQATLGFWARVRSEQGQAGWVHEPNFECTNELAGDPDCRG
ncbi:MAG: hypothetical protein AB7J28_09725 [Hyphomonadaceae bacterium]